MNDYPTRTHTYKHQSSNLLYTNQYITLKKGEVEKKDEVGKFKKTNHEKLRNCKIHHTNNQVLIINIQKFKQSNFSLICVHTNKEIYRKKGIATNKKKVMKNEPIDSSMQIFQLPWI